MSGNQFPVDRFKKIYKFYFLRKIIVQAVLYAFGFTGHLLTSLIMAGTIQLDPDSSIGRLLRSWMRESIIVFGSTVSGGLFTFGAICAGIFSVGALSLGIIAIGALSLGVIAMGAMPLGVIAIGPVSVGIIAIGECPYGLYTLSITGKGKGKYVFTPERQDTRAVALFTRLLPKFKTLFVETKS